MDAILGDPDRSGLLLVSLAEELPVNETKETLAWLDEDQVIDVLPPVVNRVLPKLEVTRRLFAAFERGAGAGRRPAPPLAVRRTAGVADQLPPGPHLPYLFGLQHPGRGGVRLADLPGGGVTRASSSPGAAGWGRPRSPRRSR